MTLLQSRQVEVPTGRIDLGVGQPNSAELPAGMLQRAAERCFTSPTADAFLQYGAEYGDGHHRLALADYLTSAYGTTIEPEHLFTTNGNSQALDLLCTVLTTPGDVVVVEEPTYFLALKIFADHGLELIGVPMDEDGIDLHRLEVALDAVIADGRRVGFIYTIPASQNPTGVTSSAQRRQALVECAARHQTVIVADEVYQLLQYGGQEQQPMSALTNSGSVISLGTFSKILAPGLRLGWVHSAPGILSRLAGSGVVRSGGGLNPTISAIATEVIRSGDLASHVANLRIEYGRRVEVMDRALKESMPDGVTWTKPTGGYFFWLRLPEGTDGSEVRRQANLAEVDFREGALFSSQQSQLGFIRLSFAFYQEDDLVEGVSRLGRVMSQPT